MFLKKFVLKEKRVCGFCFTVWLCISVYVCNCLYAYLHVHKTWVLAINERVLGCYYDTVINQLIRIQSIVVYMCPYLFVFQANNIPVLPWPSLSPDLNPIEHAWDELGRRISRGPPLQTVADLRRALVREWNRIPQAFFQRLVGSMRTRCQAVIARNGGHTRF